MPPDTARFIFATPRHITIFFGCLITSSIFIIIFFRRRYYYADAITGELMSCR